MRPDQSRDEDVILKPTVLILGAGASNPYGYPLGAQLVDSIVGLTGRGGGLLEVLSGEANVDQFHSRLRGSDVESIDDFLESNPAFAAVGKLCIAAGLTVWGPGFNHTTNSSTHWYRYLWGRLHEGASTTEQFRLNRLRIVTYNYDRSLERYLAGVLANAFPDLAERDAAAAATFLGEVLPIVHLHGSLGDSDDIARATEDRRPLIALDFFRRAATGIRIVHEDQPSEEYALTHRWLGEAQAVYLLGFGYHPTNVRRLDLLTQARNSPGWKWCGGTAFGLGDAERLRAEASLGRGAGILRQVDCLSYLREYAVLE
jgi:hypothetical protein